MMRSLFLSVLLLLPHAATAEPLAEALELALDRCQAAVETDAGFSGEGLELIERSKETHPYSIREYSIWRVPESSLSITHTVFSNRVHGKKTGQICTIHRPEDAEPLTQEQQDSLLRSFTARMERLIAQGNHERRDPTELPLIRSLGYGPLQPGPFGCPVITALFLGSDGTFVHAVTAEQACAGRKAD